MTIVIVSLYADPLHVGHCYLLRAAKNMGTTYVIVNNDRQAALKKGRSFMNEYERLEVIRCLKMVDFAILACDEDRSVCKTLRQLAGSVKSGETIIFANGGDSTNQMIPEAPVCEELGIKMIDGLGEKIQSSSVLIKEAQLIGDYKKGEILPSRRSNTVDKMDKINEEISQDEDPSEWKF